MGAMVAAMIQQTGTNIFNMFSNRIIVIMNESIPKENQIQGNIGTQMLGIVAGIFGLLAPYSVKRFNRRSLIVYGYLIVSILHGVFALFIQMG